MDPDITTFVMLSVLKCNAFYRIPNINDDPEPMNLKTTGCLLWTMAMLYGCSPGRQNDTIERNHPSPLKASQINETQINEDKDHSVRWFNAENQGKINGVALVIHGLNLQPDKMGPIISHLTASRIEVLNLSLRGHGENYAPGKDMDSSGARLDTFKTVSYEQWTDEVYRAYRHARKRSDERKAPLFLIGYSLGALLGGDLLATYPDVHFDRLVLFAPAFNCTICKGLKILVPFPRLVIPSFSSKSYCANRGGTPMAAYIALFDAIEHFKRNVSLKLNVPTIIFIDKRDEFVSYRRLKRMVETNKLDRWKIHFLQKGKIGVQESLHHLIIDERSLGKEGWDEVRDKMNQHLFNIANFHSIH